jgi:hypothetical protein
VPLITAGAGQLLTGIAQAIQGDPVNGLATTTRNSISPWRVCYGQVRTGGALVYLHSWGDQDQMLDMVIVLACHPCQSVDTLLFDQQRVQIDTTGIPTTARAGYTVATPVAGSGTSFTPVQQTINISSIVRDAHGVVTVTLPANIPYLTAGDQIDMISVSADRTLNGTFQVAEIISQIFGGPGSVKFTYLSGGTPVSIVNQGQCRTRWADYGRNVYVEYLTGAQTLGQTFIGMTAGTPWQGNGKLCTPLSPQNAGGTAGPNPWTNYCSLVGKTAVFIRLRFDQAAFPSGLPQISFLVSGKKDIYDPRTGTSGYTDNAALCIADFLSNSIWGFKAQFGSEIPAAPLIVAANVCDEPVALAIGGTEARYTCNGQFDLTQKRGEILQQMLTACAGRITTEGGQFVLHPGVWNRSVGTTIGSAPGSGKCFWLPSGTSAPSNWYAPAFDDSAWPSPVLDSGYTPGTAFTGSQWITAHAGAYSTSGDESLFRVPFALTTAPGSAALQVWSDDMTMAVYLNGMLIFSGTGPMDPSGGNTFAIGDGLLATGSNTLCIHTQNTNVFYSSVDFLLSISTYNPATAINLTAIASGPFRWRPSPSIRDLYNGCKGTYISPANKWQSTDFPAYAQNVDHGYSEDVLLTADGGERRWLELHLPFTTSAATAQRLAKIELLRRRNGGTGTFSLNMNGYQLAPLDIIAAVVPFLSWTNKILEITATRLRLDEVEGAVALSTEIEVQETDASIYQWVVEEELSPQGYIQASYPKGSVVPRTCWPWGPGYVAPLNGDAVYVKGAQGLGSFGVQPVYGLDAQGNSTIALQIKGIPPINALYRNIANPQFFATASPAGGALPAGDYVVSVSAFDASSSSHANTDYLNLAVVNVTGTGSGSISLTVIWGSGDVGGEVYVANWNADEAYQFHWNQTLAAGASTATITALDESKHGGPDPSFDHFGIVPQLIVHGGPFAQSIYAVTSTALTLAGNGMATNQWAGYTLSLLAKVNPALEIPILNMAVASSTASSGSVFTLTTGANSAGVSLPDLTTMLSVGDVVMMRHHATFAATSFTDPNIANGFYPTGATGVEAGHLAVVLTGADAGDVQTITSVTADSFGNETVFNLAGTWETIPATGDVVIVCAPVSQPEWLSGFISTKNGSSGGFGVAQPTVSNLAGQPWLIRVRTEDVNGKSGPDALAPFREVYVFGGQGTRTVLSNTTQMVNDGMLLCDTTARSLTVQLLPLASIPNMRLIVKKTSTDANIVTILPATSETIDGAASVVLSTVGGLLELKATG